MHTFSGPPLEFLKEKREKREERREPDPFKGVLGLSLAGKRPNTDQNVNLYFSFLSRPLVSLGNLILEPHLVKNPLNLYRCSVPGAKFAPPEVKSQSSLSQCYVYALPNAVRAAVCHPAAVFVGEGSPEYGGGVGGGRPPRWTALRSVYPPSSRQIRFSTLRRSSRNRLTLARVPGPARILGLG